MTTVLDALLNAQTNLETVARFNHLDNNPFYKIAKNQLDNAILALENGMSPSDVIQESLGDKVKTKP